MSRLCVSPVYQQLQSSVTEFEFSQEEYRQLQEEFWSRFYSCCLQYQEVLSSPLGLTVDPHTGMGCLLRKVSGGRSLSKSAQQVQFSFVDLLLCATEFCVLPAALLCGGSPVPVL